MPATEMVISTHLFMLVVAVSWFLNRHGFSSQNHGMKSHVSPLHKEVSHNCCELDIINFDFLRKLK